MNTWNTCKNRLAVALTLLGLVAFASPQAGLAQVDVGACGVYSSQAEAQADLDADPSLAADLDGDGNGIACEGGYAGDEDDEDDADANDGAEVSGDDDEAVSALPSTGSGPAMSAGGQLVPVAGAFALAALALTVVLWMIAGQSSARR